MSNSAAAKGSLNRCLPSRYFTCCTWRRRARREGTATSFQMKWLSTISNIVGISESSPTAWGKCRKRCWATCIFLSQQQTEVKNPTKVWLLKPTGFAWNLVKQVVALLQISVPAKLNTISSGIPGMKKFWGLFPPARREKAIQKTDRPVFSFWEVEKLQWFQESHCNLCQLRIC